MHKYLQNVKDFIGISLENGRSGDKIRCLPKIATTSDCIYFHIFMGFVDYYASQIPIPSDLIHHILIVVHSDLSSDIYINDFEIALEVVAKSKINIYSMVNNSQIADIRGINFPDVKFKETDKVIFCFKCNWRFGLYCDLAWKVQPVNAKEPVVIE